jgi:hypothetical protein
MVVGLVRDGGCRRREWRDILDQSVVFVAEPE